MPTMNMSSVTAASPQAEEVEEEQAAVKSSFTVKLIKFDAAKKVPLIKEIKQIVPEMNLVQAKKFVEVCSTKSNADCFLLSFTTVNKGN